MHHFSGFPVEILDGKIHCSFRTVQIVVNPGTFQNEQWCSNPSQPQFSSEMSLEDVFDHFYRLLGLYRVERGLVPFGYGQLHNCFALFDFLFLHDKNDFFS